mgnify:CR=1 FL=1
MKILTNSPQRFIVKLFGIGLLLGLVLVGCTRNGLYHRVEPGQTLYRISRAYDIEEVYLARVNGITDPTQLKIGTHLYIPGAASVKKIDPAPVIAATDETVVAKPNLQSEPEPSVIRPITPTPAVNRQPPVTKPSDVKLLWPLKGTIHRSFGKTTKAGGKGLEIAIRENSPVKASAAGKVIYSGDGVKGYGHLIIIQHEQDIYTVYGFNNRNLARQGDFVSQGEKIALSGTPPGGGKPRLHFEVRKKKVAVNPILYLP